MLSSKVGVINLDIVIIITHVDLDPKTCWSCLFSLLKFQLVLYNYYPAILHENFKTLLCQVTVVPHFQLSTRLFVT